MKTHSQTETVGVVCSGRSAAHHANARWAPIHGLPGRGKDRDQSNLRSGAETLELQISTRREMATSTNATVL